MKIERPVIFENPISRVGMTIKIMILGFLLISFIDSMIYNQPVSENMMYHGLYALLFSLFWTVLIPTMRQYKILFKGDPRKYF